MISVPKNKSLVGIILGVVVLSSHYNAVNGAVPPRSRDSTAQNPDLDPITLEDVLNGAFGAKGFSGQWDDRSDNLIRIFKEKSVDNYNIETGNDEMIVNITEIRQLLPPGSLFSNIIFSNDGKYALIEHGRSNVWRYSATAKYDVFDIEKREITSKLVPTETGEGDEQPALQLVKWSPNGNGIAFIYNYNIYYRPEAADGTVWKLTEDGKDEQTAIYNGIADWVYEEEMLGGPTALWISKSGNNLAFIRFNDSQVSEFQWPMYGEPRSPDSIYPEIRRIRYPKSGTPNPEVDVYIVSLTDGVRQPRKLEYIKTSAEDHHLIGTATWATDDELLVATLNREQTILHWHLCKENCEQIYTYNLNHGWIDMNTPSVSADGSKFLFVQSVQQDGDIGSYKHIVMFMADKSERKVLTKGQLSVDSILGWDETNHKVYFSGTFWDGSVADPSQVQIYSTSDDGSSSMAHCLTCEFKNGFNSTCKTNTAMFSAKFTYYIHRCGGPDVPMTTTRFTESGAAIDNPGPTLVLNEELHALLEKKAVPISKEYTVPVGPDGKFTARARLFFPANYNESRKYPLLISVYGGPGSQNLGQGFGIPWEMSLVSSGDIIFGYIDGRGTSKQSSEHLFELHRKLGTAEIEDQITVAKWLIENEKVIDAEKTSIWGWSYGGYASVKVLETDTGHVFKCGMSVAPVTTWRFYDTIYTERYMGLPTEEDNLKGYEESDVLSKAGVMNLRDKMYMLVHGNADDNVHYQQSMVLARAMEQNDIFFHQLSYPDENHGISGPGMRRHLYHSLERFLFDECYHSARPSSNRSGAGTVAASLAALVLTYALAVFRYAM